MPSRRACSRPVGRMLWISSFDVVSMRGEVLLGEKMNNGQTRDLCIGLLQAEAEGEVIELLNKAGFWNDPKFWRHYGDVENNWGQSGNQQSLAEAALVEKIVNSVDARLVNECWERGIDPTGPDAPKTIREAVSRFFEGGT